jgi:hypothetical protein
VGSKYREPRPKSPERLRIVSFDSASFERDDEYATGAVTVKATFSYYTWCCNDSHEIADAIAALETAITQASIRAEKKRRAGAEKEHEELREELRAQGHIE